MTVKPPDTLHNILILATTTGDNRKAVVLFVIAKTQIAKITNVIKYYANNRNVKNYSNFSVNPDQNLNRGQHSRSAQFTKHVQATNNKGCKVVRQTHHTNPSQIKEEVLKADIVINGKALSAIVNTRRRAGMVNRTIVKLVEAQTSTINNDLIHVPITVNGKTTMIPCITNYMLNVPIILGSDAITELGFRLSLDSHASVHMEEEAIVDGDTNKPNEKFMEEVDECLGQ